MPKRPKGRLLVGGVLFAVCAWGVLSLWDAFFRYRAYGTVVGRVIQISSDWDGVIQYWHVRDGETVRQGQLLVTLDSPTLRDRLAQLGDELRVAEAEAQAELSRLKWLLRVSDDGSQRVLANYYETWGRLLNEQARLDTLVPLRERAEILRDRQVNTEQDLEEAEFSERGQRELVEKLTQAVRELKQRVDLAASVDDDGAQQVRPKLVKVETLLAEAARVRSRLTEGRILAPVDGTVVKRLHFAGERAVAREPLLSLLESDSLQVVIYLPQRASKQLLPGDELGVLVEPYPELVQCQVLRLGDQFETAPENVQAFYRRYQKLLPVYLLPKIEYRVWMALRVDSVVKVP